MPFAQRLGELTIANSFAGLPADFYTRLATRPLKAPRVLHANPAAAHLLGPTGPWELQLKGAGMTP